MTFGSKPSLLGCAVITVLAAALPAQRGKRAVMPKAMANAMPVALDQLRVVVKLVEGRADVAAAGRILASDVLAVVGARAVRPFFFGLEQQLEQIRSRQLARTPKGERPEVDLSLYFEVDAVSPADTRELVIALNALPTVELAYPRERPTPPPGHVAPAGRAPGDIPPVTPDFTQWQDYQDPAPNGIDAAVITAMTGGMGAGITVLDIEWAWYFDHEDIARLRYSSLIGPPASQPFGDHGVAVAGVIAADADIWGVTGMNPDVDFKVATNYPWGGYSTANAIANGLPALSAGDVMLLEAQAQTSLGLGPTEWYQADFDAILIATGLGIVTVEAAGNGNVDLDDPQLGGLFDINVRDSGAIIVGGTNAGSQTRYWQGSYGTRVDANGWALGVVTAGYGDGFDPGDIRQQYTRQFGGTSSASAIVTSAVVALRGAATAQLEPTAAAALDTFAIRTLLRTWGTPVFQVSNRPDCRAMFDATGIARGLAVLNEPRTGQSCTIELMPSFTPTAGDLWAFVGSDVTGNQPMPLGYPGRFLLGGTTVPLGLGGFAGATKQASIPIPNSTAYRGLRYYIQGFTFEAATTTVEPTNSIQLYVRR